WMQTPAGFGINEAGQFVATDWWAVIFNPSFPYRLVHMVLAAYLTSAFMVGATGAWHLLRDRTNERARVMFSMAMWMAALVAPLQIAAGDMHGLNTLEHQPAKVAAMEGHFETRNGAPLILFGIPNMKNATVDYKVEIPKLGSLILKHSTDGQVKGLKEWPRADWPYVPIVFWSFRIMVALGFAMVGLGLWGLWMRWRGALFDAPWLQRAAVVMGPSGFAAVLAGWITTEAGRQPWTVYGLLRTAQSASPVEAPAIAASLAAFFFIYLAVFGAGTFYAVRLMLRIPDPSMPDEHEEKPARAAGLMPGPVLAAENLLTGDQGRAKP
ncbi:MAG: cytochrome ubiquinol oxidase subunit I, partial [Hyphomicrobiales bacterium]|nr:cytochrome ubiquinol oxidase subunit I [Hyphomicrobiales bacterium]